MCTKRAFVWELLLDHSKFRTVQFVHIPRHHVPSDYIPELVVALLSATFLVVVNNRRHHKVHFP